MSEPKIAFIGAGNMAGAIIGGLIAKGYTKEKICAADPLAENLQKLQQSYGISGYQNNDEAISEADVVILAIKPQIMAKVAEQIKGAINTRQPLVISIAAGITLSSLQNWLGDSLAMVRCMPNTPALVLSGATALFANDCVSEQQKGWADQLLSAIGLALWVEDEAQLDVVTAVSGSGPAYFFLAMEAMIAAGEQLGLDKTLCEQLTLQTALGAAKMAMASDVDAAELRRRVTSPGGTTAAALQVFEEGQFQQLFSDALSAAEARSKAMAKELGA